MQVGVMTAIHRCIGVGFLWGAAADGEAAPR